MLNQQVEFTAAFWTYVRIPEVGEVSDVADNREAALKGILQKVQPGELVGLMSVTDFAAILSVRMPPRSSRAIQEICKEGKEDLPHRLCALPAQERPLYVEGQPKLNAFCEGLLSTSEGTAYYVATASLLAWAATEREFNSHLLPLASPTRSNNKNVRSVT
jgi:hypothetical protein